MFNLIILVENFGGKIFAKKILFKAHVFKTFFHNTPNFQNKKHN